MFRSNNSPMISKVIRREHELEGTHSIMTSLLEDTLLQNKIIKINDVHLLQKGIKWEDKKSMRC